MKRFLFVVIFYSLTMSDTTLDSTSLLAMILGEVTRLRNQLADHEHKMNEALKAIDEKLETYIALTNLSATPKARTGEGSIASGGRAEKWSTTAERIYNDTWNKDEHGHPRTQDEIDGLPSLMYQLAKNEIAKINDIMYIPGKERQWRNIKTPFKNQLVENLEEQAEKRNVLMYQCENHWLAKALLSQAYNDIQKTNNNSSSSSRNNSNSINSNSNNNNNATSDM
jgi:hypothetical protein